MAFMRAHTLLLFLIAIALSACSSDPDLAGQRAGASSSDSLRAVMAESEWVSELQAEDAVLILDQILSSRSHCTWRDAELDSIPDPFLASLLRESQLLCLILEEALVEAKRVLRQSITPSFIFTFFDRGDAEPFYQSVIVGPFEVLDNCVGFETTLREAGIGTRACQERGR